MTRGRFVAAVLTQHSNGVPTSAADGIAVRTVGQVHADWQQTPEAEHPLIPTVRWWQNKVASENAEPRTPGEGGGMLPGIDRAGLVVTSRETAMLTRARDRVTRDAVTMQLPGPDWDSTATQYRPWVTDLYTTAGGIGSSRGRGATWDEALFVGALLHLRVDDRNGRPRQIAVKAREIESWLFPSGRMPHPGRDWHKLPEALLRVDQMRIHLPAINADVRVVAIDSIPMDRDGYVSFHLVLPTDAAHGPRIDWQTLIRYRALSRTRLPRLSGVAGDPGPHRPPWPARHQTHTGPCARTRRQARLVSRQQRQAQAPQVLGSRDRTASPRSYRPLLHRP